MVILKLFGIGLAIYGAYGIWVGEIYSTYNGETKLIVREKEPVNFWVNSLSYVFVGCLIFVIILNRYG